MIKNMTQSNPTNANALKHFITASFDGLIFNALEIKRTGKGITTGKSAEWKIPSEVDTSDPQALGEALQRYLQESSLAKLPIFLAIPGPDTTFKHLFIPVTTDDNELSAMIQMQLPNELPFDADEAIVDYMLHPDDEHEDKMQSISLAAIRTERLKEYQQWQSSGHLSLHSITLRSLATWALLRQTCDDSEEDTVETAILLGQNYCQIMLFNTHRLIFSEQHDLDQPLTEQNQEEQLLALTKVSKLLQRSLMTSIGLNQQLKVNSCTIAGNTGKEATLKNILSESGWNEPKLWASTEHKDLKPGDMVLLGLAHLHLQPEMEQINFLAPKRPIQKRSLMKPLIGLTILSVLIACGYGIYRAQSHVDSRRQSFEKLQSKHSEIKKKVKETKALVKQNEAVQEWVAQENAWLDHFARISAALPPADQAYLLSFDTNPDSSFNIKARYKDDQVLSLMIQQLNDQGYTVNEIGGHQPRNDKYEYPYETSFRLYPPARENKDEIELVAVSTLKATARPKDDDSINRLKAKPKSSSTRRRY